jgi:hypothetical protein
MEIKQWTFSSGEEVIGQVLDYHQDKVYVTNTMKIYNINKNGTVYSAMEPFMHGTIDTGMKSTVIEINARNIIATCIPSDAVQAAYFGILTEERQLQKEESQMELDWSDDEEEPKVQLH